MKIYNEGTEYASTVYEFSDLIGKTLKTVINHDDERITFETSDDEVFSLYHHQDCCEQVHVESITGDLQDLVGTPILVAEERASDEDPDDIVEAAKKEQLKAIAEGRDWYPYSEESQTWTFYTLRTIKGSVDIRWHGSSNGYYSESVDFSKS